MVPSMPLYAPSQVATNEPEVLVQAVRAGQLVRRVLEKPLGVVFTTNRRSVSAPRFR